MKKILSVLVAIFLFFGIFTSCDLFAQIAETTKDTWYRYDYEYINAGVTTELYVYMCYTDSGYMKNVVSENYSHGLNIVIIANPTDTTMTGKLAAALANNKYIFKNFPKNEVLEIEGATKEIKLNDDIWGVIYVGLNKKIEEDQIPACIHTTTARNWTQITDLESIQNAFSWKNIVKQMLWEYLE